MYRIYTPYKKTNYKAKYHFNHNYYQSRQNNDDLISKGKIKDILIPEHIYIDLKKHFFSLNSQQLNCFLKFYEEKYGSGARKYARQTFEAWTSGNINISSETQKRILQIVPKLLSTNERFNLFEEILQYNIKNKYHPIQKVLDYELAIEEFKTQKKLIIQEMVKITEDHYQSIEYSKLFDFSAINWIVEDDVTAFNQLLQNIEKERAKETLKTALFDLEQIEKKWNKIDWSNNSSNESEIRKTIETPILKVNIIVYNPVYRRIKGFYDFLGGLAILSFPFLISILGFIFSKGCSK